ncbi:MULTISPECIES: GntR family transcriptional regulator [unclassified Brachybacterium]|uniref:GntR family transcriptional regulator n=1 Tax=unclassified Brachybacterium TaxID=2623841 RepID=UPI003617651C
METRDEPGVPASSLMPTSRSPARSDLREYVYDSILEMLLRDDAPPGARLSISTIAEQLDVSPTPVREALVQLERTGLVTRTVRKGYRVSPPLGQDQLAELFTAREMLECTAVRLAAAASPAALLPELRAAQEQHRRAGEAVITALDSGRRDVSLAADYFARDREFHEVIFRHCGNRYLMEMSQDLGSLVHRLRRMVHRGVTDVREAIGEHEAIIDALESGDAAAGESAMREHIRNVIERSTSDQA